MYVYVFIEIKVYLGGKFFKLIDFKVNILIVILLWFIFVKILNILYCLKVFWVD